MAALNIQPGEGPYDGELMPYHWPRGDVHGAERGLYVSIAYVLVSFAVMVAAFVVMATHHLP